MGKQGSLRVWWIRNAPREPEFHEVVSIQEAKELLDKLADEDLKNEDVDDNAGGLEVFTDEGGWGEWYDDDSMDICEVMKEEFIAKEEAKRCRD